MIPVFHDGTVIGQWLVPPPNWPSRKARQYQFRRGNRIITFDVVKKGIRPIGLGIDNPSDLTHWSEFRPLTIAVH